MKDLEIQIGYGDVVRLSSGGRLLVGNPHRNYQTVDLGDAELRRIRKYIKRMLK